MPIAIGREEPMITQEPAGIIAVTKQIMPEQQTVDTLDRKRDQAAALKACEQSSRGPRDYGSQSSPGSSGNTQNRPKQQH